MKDLLSSLKTESQLAICWNFQMMPSIKIFRLFPPTVLCMLITACHLAPKLGIETSGKNVIVHVETLADYPTKVDRIIIFKESDPDEKVFEASSDHGQIWRIELHAGKNDLSALRKAGTYKMLVPRTGSFVMLPSELYRVSVCYAGRCNSAPFRVK